MFNSYRIAYFFVLYFNDHYAEFIVLSSIYLECSLTKLVKSEYLIMKYLFLIFHFFRKDPLLINWLAQWIL